MIIEVVRAPRQSHRGALRLRAAKLLILCGLTAKRRSFYSEVMSLLGASSHSNAGRHLLSWLQASGLSLAFAAFGGRVTLAPGNAAMGSASAAAPSLARFDGVAPFAILAYWRGVSLSSFVPSPSSACPMSTRP